MSSFQVLPEEFDFESLGAISSYSHCKVFQDELVIKEYSRKYYDVSVLDQLTKLQIEGYLFPHVIYQSENGNFFYLVSKYLKESETLDVYASHATCLEVLKVFRTILIQLRSAHSYKYNPYDLFPYNYVVEKKQNVWNIDCDLSFYQKNCTSDDDLDVLISCFSSYFQLDFDHSELSYYYLNLYDKLQVLTMLFYYLKHQELFSYDNLYSYSQLKAYVASFLDLHQIPAVEPCLMKFLKNDFISYSDYFISTLVDSFIHFYESLEGRGRRMT